MRIQPMNLEKELLLSEIRKMMMIITNKSLAKTL